MLLLYLIIGCGLGIFGQLPHDIVCKFIFTYLKYIIFISGGFLIVYLPIMYSIYKKSLLERKKSEILINQAEKEERDKKILKNILKE
jgi:hypothetical protein